MNTYPRLPAENNIDMEAGCLVRFVYGGDDAYFPHCHDYFEIFIIAKGTVPHMVNNVMQNLPEGSLVFIRPDDIHAHICNDPETAFINLTFTRETAKTVLAYLFTENQVKKMLFCDMPPLVFLDKTNRKRLVSQINELNTEDWKDKGALKIRMRAILASILPYFTESLPEKAQNDIPLWLSELTRKMEKSENFIAGTSKMIELSKKSREHLARSFKKYYGINITDYINDLRINYASNLLINTNIPVIDICFGCGFQSASYFYRVFKNKNNSTPHLFREMHKINKI